MSPPARTNVPPSGERFQSVGPLLNGPVASAVSGGLVAASVAGRGSKAPLGLAGFVFVFGMISAAAGMTEEPADPGERTAEVDKWEAMKHAQQPQWFALANAFIGAGGVVVGAGLRWKSGVSDGASDDSTTEAKADAFMEGAEGDGDAS